jgi:hypothetical protein
MKAIIISDDFAFAASAAVTLSRVGCEAGLDVQWLTKWWPMTALKDEALAEIALDEASDAHLVLFPGRCVEPLPSPVFHWLDRWVAVRTIAEAALGILKAAGDPTLSSRTFPELSAFARDHGLTLIADECLPREIPVRVPIQLPNDGEWALPLTPVYSADVAMQVSYRGFGINE